MNPLYPHQGNYNDTPGPMHPWNGYNGPPPHPQYPPYPPTMHGYPQQFARQPSHFGGLHVQNQRFQGTYYQGRSYQNWNQAPPRVSNYPKKMPPTGMQKTISPSEEKTGTTSGISSESISIDLADNTKTVTKTESLDTPVKGSETGSGLDIKLEDKKNVIPLVNLCEDLETPEERLNRFRFETRTKILQQLCGCQDESKFIVALRQFKEVLESQNGEIKMKYELMNLLGKYLPFLAKNYKVIGTSCVDEYLAIMEDILVVYCQLVRDFINVQIDRKKKRNLSRLAARIRYLLTICLLYRMDSILHCLFKVQLYPNEVEHSRMWTYIFVYFLKRAKYNHQNADYLRCFIGWQKVKTIRGNTSSDEIDGVMYTRFSKSIADLKALKITCLTEIIESMENDPRYCIRDMIRRYWRWWNVEKPKDFLADLEEPTTLILPGEIEDNHKEIFVEQKEIDPITRLFQEKRMWKRTDLTQIALNFNKEAEDGNYNFSFTDGAQHNCLTEDIPGPIIIGDAVTIEDEPDDLLIVPPTVMDTVVIDSDGDADDDDDIIFIPEEPKKPQIALVRTDDNNTEVEVSLLSPAPIAEQPQQQQQQQEQEVNIVVPSEPANTSEEEPPGPTETDTNPEPPTPDPPVVVRSLFGDLTEDDLELEEVTFDMDFTAEDSSRLPDIPDSLVLPKAENLFGDSDDEWSNLDMNTVLNSIGESPMDFDDHRGDGSNGLFDGPCNDNVKTEKESPKKEKTSENQESTQQTENPKTPTTSASPIDQITKEPPQKESQNESLEPLEPSEVPDTTTAIENTEPTTNLETKDVERSSTAMSEPEKTPTRAESVETTESQSSPESRIDIEEIDDSTEDLASTLTTVNGEIECEDDNKEKQTLVIQLEKLSEQILRNNEKETRDSSVESEVFWSSCTAVEEHGSPKKMPDDIDDLQQIYLRGRHTDKSRHSSCSLEAPLFESLDKNEVRQFFDENLAKSASSVAAAAPSSPIRRPETPAPAAPNSTEINSTTVATHHRDPRLEGGTETAKRYRPPAVLSPAHQIRQSWSEAIADAMAISQGAESYEDFICGEGALIIDQSHKRCTRTPSSDTTRPIVDLWTNFVPDIAPLTEDVRSTVSDSVNCKSNTSSMIDLASPCLDSEAVTIQCRTILKQENDVDSSAHQLTPDWVNDDRHYTSASAVSSTYGTSLTVHPSPPYSRENSPNDVENVTNINVPSPMLYSPLLKDSRGIRSFYISDIVQENAGVQSRVSSSSSSSSAANNNNNNNNRASPKQHSVTFLEQVSKEFYANEFGSDLDGGYHSKKDRNLPSKNKPSTQTSAQAQSVPKPAKSTVKSPVRAHITAEAELFLPSNQNAVTTITNSVPTPVWGRNSTGGRGAVDPQVYKSKPVQKKTKVNGTELSHNKRREVVVNNELAKYKNPSQLDVKFLCNATVKLKLLSKKTIEHFTRRKPSTPSRMFKRPREPSYSYYERPLKEKSALRKQRENGRREAPLCEQTGIVYAIFSEKFVDRAPLGRLGGLGRPYFPFDCQDDVTTTPTGRKVRFEGETEQQERNHAHNLVRIDAEKRPSQDEADEGLPKRAKLSHNAGDKYPSKGILKKKARITTNHEHHNPAIAKPRVIAVEKRNCITDPTQAGEIRVIKRGRPKKEASSTHHQGGTRKKINIHAAV
ncbi:uncharacterized protein LOC126734828 isoform X2 [Anthonomus grandis grandis]|uniref:uncharacterized protein LOC126734828 isoform X2 n=1 Tax=Anthonomus grandis grandis TaxID=2921223 RepID=UPI002165FB3E|nr:uncharacterized protein LOC126734828 isoform X2 [Anthonomus grandis grandis]